jgi:hypothetical protein
MKITLVPNWKAVLKKAWSIRLWALAAVFETSGVVLPLFVDIMPKWAFSLLALVTAAGGIWARLVEQKGIKP